ncbi:MAG: phosphoribosylglycinamide formyltransferase [Rhodospirillaceae bacterium]|mgnify:CR=1 FL=1|nr:phosphoribosylglycinamide formyltransferase [Rhodospirillaceae bacterium]|tara:strand:- start:6651 stop:7310 length:660 start_codon:yes stop_codon:yes gene_type:complete
MAKLKAAVLISGRGSNMQALIDYCKTDAAAAEIVLVISNVPGAAGLDRAAEASIPTTTIDHKKFADRESFEKEITQTLENHQVEMICLAGFMRLLTKSFVDHWQDRLINIHPSLLPAFKGLDTHERALAEGVRFTGCTVHFVRAEMDSGPIIVQAAVPILSDDDPESLAMRVLIAEHRCYPLALSLIAQGKIEIVGERVLIEGAEAPGVAFLNPTDDVD